MIVLRPITRTRLIHSFRTSIICFLSVFFNPHLILAIQEQVHYDVVIRGGIVYSPSRTSDTAVGIRGNQIVAIGNDQTILKGVGPLTRQVDAEGGAITPGLNDAHVHFFSGSNSLDQVDLLAEDTQSKVESAIERYAAKNPEKKWIQGRGWLYGAFPEGLPKKQILDRIVSDRPVLMRCYDGHTVWVNSKALQLANIHRSTRNPDNGEIVRDANGEPTGVLKEAAQNLIDSIVPQPDRNEKREAIQKAIAIAHQLGVTSVQEAGLGEEDIAILDSLRQEGQLPLRFSIALEARPGFTEQDADRLDQVRRKFSQLKIGAVKFYADGVIESHTAAMLQPYSNRNTLGMPEYARDDLLRTVAMLDRRNWQVWIHAIGDGGIRMSLDAIESAIAQNPIPTRGRRHRLEHIESISQADISRFGKLEVIASMQPMHANPNGNIFNVWAVNLGPERAARAWAWKSIRDAGGRLAFGTDWPVVGLDPRPGLHVAIYRQTPEGDPPQGFVPSQRLDALTALEAYTAGAAYAEFAEKERGFLAPGMAADIVVWDRDWLQEPPLPMTTRVQFTLFDGRIVYSARP